MRIRYFFFFLPNKLIRILATTATASAADSNVSDFTPNTFFFGLTKPDTAPAMLLAASPTLDTTPLTEPVIFSASCSICGTVSVASATSLLTFSVIDGSCFNDAASGSSLAFIVVESDLSRPATRASTMARKTRAVTPANPSKILISSSAETELFNTYVPNISELLYVFFGFCSRFFNVFGCVGGSILGVFLRLLKAVLYVFSDVCGSFFDVFSDVSGSIFNVFLRFLEAALNVFDFFLRNVLDFVGRLLDFINTDFGLGVQFCSWLIAGLRLLHLTFDAAGDNAAQKTESGTSPGLLLLNDIKIVHPFLFHVVLLILSIFGASKGSCLLV